MSSPLKPLVLIILDGWGYREDTSHNPTRNVKTPTIDALWNNHPHLLLEASGKAVGLPDGQMGNSEVGHLHLGAGRKVPQDLVRINNEIESGAFEKNPVFLNAIKQAKDTDKAIHIIGLLSPGGVHSHENQLAALIQMIGEQGVLKNYYHALLDGRDTPPQSALKSIQKIDQLYQKLPDGQIASITGRYYGMDRDKRWDRTQKAYDLLTLGKADYTASDAQTALKDAYARGETDEFVKPTIINNAITVRDGDILIFMNFRADRARQLTHAFIDPHFNGFIRQKTPLLSQLITLTEYFENDHIHVAYPPLQIHNTLGEYVSQHGLSQLRIAETEKYAHVTYFLNGGVETPFSHEDRALIPSPQIATYDLQPEMSAIPLTDRLVEAIESQKYDLIICNYANPDMVGHTGIESAAQAAVSVIDQCLARIITALQKVNGQACITADHGNIELMYDEKHAQPHTAHTTNLVPFIYIGKPAHVTQSLGALDDVAPTVLYLLGMKPPKEMTGHVLLQCD